MPPPYVAVVKRKESGNAEEYPNLTPLQLNERLLETVAPQKAPDPIRYGDTPARLARMPMYSVLAMRQIRAVAFDAQSGVMGKRMFAQLASTPRGKSLAWNERSNISHDPAESLGNIHTVVAQTSNDDQLRAEMGL